MKCNGRALGNAGKILSTVKPVPFTQCNHNILNPQHGTNSPSSFVFGIRNVITKYVQLCSMLVKHGLLRPGRNPG